MKADIWMPWFISDYERDTKDLSLEEDCIYRRALDFIWQNPVGLPWVSSRLCRCLRISEAELDRNRWVLDKYLEKEGDYYRSKRLAKEYAKALKRKEASAGNGKLGGRPPKPSDNLEFNLDGNLDPNLEKSSSPSPSPIKNNNPPCIPPSGETAQRSSRKKSKKPINDMPADFCLTPAMREYAAKKGMADPDHEFEAFCARHRAKGNQFADWPAAWRNWVLNHKKWGKPLIMVPAKDDWLKGVE